MKEVRMMDVPIVEFMTRMTDIHTEAWKEDLSIDIHILERIKTPEDLRRCELPNAFFWISRRHGTNMIPEAKAFFDETSANSVLTYYMENDPDNIRVFLLEPSEIAQGEKKTLYGSVCELDPQETLRFMKANSLHYESSRAAGEASVRLDYALSDYGFLNERFPYADEIPKDIKETYIQVREKHRLMNEKRNHLAVVNYEDYLDKAARQKKAPKREQKKKGR